MKLGICSSDISIHCLMPHSTVGLKMNPRLEKLHAYGCPSLND
jgi:hypothetical protein